MSWLEEPLVGFDTETTGVDVYEDRIVTASLVWVTPSGVADSRQWLINPGIPIPAAATEVHGITTEMAQAEGTEPRIALEEITAALAETLSRGTPIVAFNASYDLTLLEVENARHGIATLESRLAGDIWPILDPLVMDKHVDRFRRGKRWLTTVAEHYGVGLMDAHDAQADALAAAQLVPKILAAYPDLSVMSPLELHDAQIRWRADQQTSLIEYFKRVGNERAAASVSTSWPLDHVV